MCFPSDSTLVWTVILNDIIGLFSDGGLVCMAVVNSNSEKPPKFQSSGAVNVQLLTQRPSVLSLGICTGGVWDIQRGPGSHGRAQRSGHDGPAYQRWLGICQRAPQEQEEVRGLCVLISVCLYVMAVQLSQNSCVTCLCYILEVMFILLLYKISIEISLIPWCWW